MTNKQKRKGSDFERLAVNILNEYIDNSEWRRIPGSGALGTIMDEPILMADIIGTVESIPRKIKMEAKVGYGGAKQFTLKREWLDKVAEEAETDFSIPVLIGKFSGAREGTKIFTVLDIDTFVFLINYITELKEQLDEHND